MNNPKITYHDNGNVLSESYYLNGKRHRENGPAFIFYYKNGKIYFEHYYLNDKYHRENGPAVIFYDNGKIESERYYLNGILYVDSESKTFRQDLKKYHSMVKLKSFW